MATPIYVDGDGTSSFGGRGLRPEEEGLRPEGEEPKTERGQGQGLGLLLLLLLLLLLSCFSRVRLCATP